MHTTSSPTRRAVAKGAAWSVPLVAGASTVPAYAVSNCEKTVATHRGGRTTQTAASGSMSNGITVTSAATTGATSKMFLTTSGEAGNGGNRGRYNFSVVNLAPPGATAGAYLELNQRTLLKSYRQASQTVTFTFPQPVYCVEFWVTDIDYESGYYGDVVTVPGAVATPSTPADVTCSGPTCRSAHSGSPGAFGVFPGTELGLVHYKLTGQGLTSFSLTYSSNSSGNSSTNYQQVYISPISYTTRKDCTCT
ncbi:MAG: hypothetical protein L0G59_06345 [Kocuria sp.]|nr:hypothetical protein [Kocuria sp.]MDN5617748.1 hypothetical protein [Kocuria sp.]MDN5653808.1 hypothetical protein [Kocuria sp.]